MSNSIQIVPFENRKNQRNTKRKGREKRKQRRIPRQKPVTRKQLGFSPQQKYRFENNQNLQQYVAYGAATWSYAMALTYLGGTITDYGRGSDLTPHIDETTIFVIMRQPVNYSYTYRFMVVKFLDKIDVSDYSTFAPSVVMESTPNTTNFYSIQEKLRRNQDPKFVIESDLLMVWDTSSNTSENIRIVKINIPSDNPAYVVASNSGAIASGHQLLVVLTDALIQNSSCTSSYTMYRTFDAEQ